MSGECSKNDILDQYHTISNKLKKRFLRKPNVTEACDSFGALGQHCERSELPAYAGLCWIASARCEGSLTNVPGEAACLIRAARQFFKAEKDDFDIACSSPAMENLQAGLGCFTYASSRFPDEDCPLPISLNLEIVDYLKKLDRNDLIEDYLTYSIDLSKENYEMKLLCMELLGQHLIDSSDFIGALNIYTEITIILNQLTLNGAREESLLKCEINRILLLLILRPSPQKLSPNSAKLLEKYTWGDKSDQTLQEAGMTERLFLLLQSLVAVCQSSDTKDLGSLESELWPLFDKQQRDLLRILVKIYYR